MPDTCEYLYNCDPSEFKDMTYIDALNFKVDKAIDNILRLAQEGTEANKNSAKYRGIIAHYQKCVKAKEFNEKLLMEVDG